MQTVIAMVKLHGMRLSSHETGGAEKSFIYHIKKKGDFVACMAV